MLLWVIAQVSTTTGAPEVDQVEPRRPLTRYLTDLLGLDPDGYTAGLLHSIVEPILQILLIVVMAALVLWLVRRLGRRVLRGVASGVEGASPRAALRVNTLAGVASNVLGAVVWSIAVLTILASVFGISLAPFLAGAGILGIAIGFGSQDLVRDMISGLFMMVEDQYGVGDIVDVGEANGTVERLGIRSTRIRSGDGTLWHVPNGEIRRVGNMSQEWSRTVLDVAVGYDADVARATEIIGEVATAMTQEEGYVGMFLSDPEVLGVESVRSDRVVLRVAVKTKAGEQWKIARELRSRIKAALDQAGIPPPVTDARLTFPEN